MAREHRQNAIQCLIDKVWSGANDGRFGNEFLIKDAYKKHQYSQQYFFIIRTSTKKKTFSKMYTVALKKNVWYEIDLLLNNITVAYFYHPLVWSLTILLFLFKIFTYHGLWESAGHHTKEVTLFSMLLPSPRTTMNYWKRLGKLNILE